MGRKGRHLLPLLAIIAAAGCGRRNGGAGVGAAAPPTTPSPPAPSPTPSPTIVPPALQPDPVVMGGDAAAPATDGGRPASDGAPPFLRPEFGVTSDPAKPPPPVSGGTLTVLAGGSTAVASDPDRDHVVIADLVAWKVAFDVALQPHDEPGRVVEGPAGTVFVALRRGGAVVTIDTTTGAIESRRSVCSAPRGLAYDATAQLLHVACAGGELVSLPAAGGPEARRLLLDDDLRDVVVSGNDLVVSRFRSAEVLTVNAAGAVTSRRRPAPASTEMLEASVAWRMRSLADGSIVLVHQGGFTGAIAVDGQPIPSDAGAPADAAPPPPAPPGTYVSSGSCTSIVAAMVTVFAPDGTSTTVSVQDTVLPVDVAMDTATGSPVVIHAAGANTPSTNRPLAEVAVSPQQSDCQQQLLPPSVSFDARPPGQLVAIEAGAAGSFFVQTREPSTLWRSSDGRVLTLSNESHADVGHAIFHADANGLACASCHPEGGEDGRVWKFSPVGSRRTPSLRGGVGGTEPFHWDGSLATLSSLMSEVFVRRMQGPALAPDQVDALYRWLDGAIPLLPGVVTDSGAVARGRALFVDPQVGCSTCHAGALLTNNATVDVGTGQPFQVPSLRGVGWRAPYLHNGCAATLLDRFGSCGGGESHGHTAALAPTDLADLVSYLRSL